MLWAFGVVGCGSLPSAKPRPTPQFSGYSQEEAEQLRRTVPDLVAEVELATLGPDEVSREQLAKREAQQAALWQVAKGQAEHIEAMRRAEGARKARLRAQQDAARKARARERRAAQEAAAQEAFAHAQAAHHALQGCLGRPQGAWDACARHIPEGQWKALWLQVQAYHGVAEVLEAKQGQRSAGGAGDGPMLALADRSLSRLMAALREAEQRLGQARAGLVSQRGQSPHGLGAGLWTEARLRSPGEPPVKEAEGVGWPVPDTASRVELRRWAQMFAALGRLYPFWSVSAYGPVAEGVLRGLSAEGVSVRVVEGAEAQVRRLRFGPVDL